MWVAVLEEFSLERVLKWVSGWSICAGSKGGKWQVVLEGMALANQFDRRALIGEDERD